MDRFETKALSNYPLQPLIWKRFIDDIFLIWTHGEDSLKEFVNYINNLHPTIKFTSETSTETINFLDMTVKLNNQRQLITTLYNKPLHHSSAHLESVAWKGPYEQYFRIGRICTLVYFVYLGFYVAFNTVQVISRRVVGRAEETSTYSSLGFCTVNCRPTASNYQLSHLRP